MASIVAGVVAIAAWFVFTFVAPVGLGIVHVLLGMGVALVIRWWALRGEDRGAAPVGKAPTQAR